MAETTVRKWESLVSERNWLLYGCIFFTTCTVIFVSVFGWAYGNWQWELNNTPSPNMPPPPIYPSPSPPPPINMESCWYKPANVDCTQNTAKSLPLTTSTGPVNPEASFDMCDGFKSYAGSVPTNVYNTGMTFVNVDSIRYLCYPSEQTCITQKPSDALRYTPPPGTTCKVMDDLSQ